MKRDSEMGEKHIDARGLFGPYPSRGSLFLVRNLLALERFVIGKLRRISSPSAAWHSRGWTDGFYTPHNKAFMTSNRFIQSYLVAIGLAGSDYRIPWRVHQAQWCVQVATQWPGDLIEIGTGRGFVMAGVLSFLDDETFVNREVFLCDVFSSHNQSQLGMSQHAGVYAENADQVRAFFGRWPAVKVVEGDIRQTIHGLLDRKFCFVHVDLNDPEVEVQVLDLLWASLAPAALILFDDYANAGMERSRALIDEFMEKKKIPVLTTPAGQGIALVRS